MRQPSHQAIILFDGVCNLCNASVNFIIDHDPRHYFRFAAQQSPAGQALLERCHLPADALQSVVLIEQGRHYTLSDAALRIARRLTGWPRLASLAVAIPPFGRDLVYTWIARNRYRWFGKREACRVPSEDLAGRFPPD